MSSSSTMRWLGHGALQLNFRDRAPIHIPLHRPHHREEDFYVQFAHETDELGAELIIDLHPKSDGLRLEQAILRWPDEGGRTANPFASEAVLFGDGYAKAPFWKKLWGPQVLQTHFHKTFAGKSLGSQTLIASSHATGRLNSLNEQIAWSAFHFDGQRKTWTLERDFEGYPLRHSLVLAHIKWQPSRTLKSIPHPTESLSENPGMIILAPEIGMPGLVLAKAIGEHQVLPAENAIAVLDTSWSLDDLASADPRASGWETFVKTCRENGLRPALSLAPLLLKHAGAANPGQGKVHYSRALRAPVQTLDLEQAQGIRYLQQALAKVHEAGFESVLLLDFAAAIWHMGKEDRTRAQVLDFSARLLRESLGEMPLICHDLPFGLLDGHNLYRMASAPASLHAKARPARKGFGWIKPSGPRCAESFFTHTEAGDPEITQKGRLCYYR